MTEGIRQGMWRAEEKEQIGLWLNADRDESMVKSRNQKKERKEKRRLNGG